MGWSIGLAWAGVIRKERYFCSHITHLVSGHDETVRAHYARLEYNRASPSKGQQQQEFPTRIRCRVPACPFWQISLQRHRLTPVFL